MTGAAFNMNWGGTHPPTVLDLPLATKHHEKKSIRNVQTRGVDEPPPPPPPPNSVALVYLSGSLRPITLLHCTTLIGSFMRACMRFLDLLGKIRVV